jgi:hypothetical protein
MRVFVVALLGVIACMPSYKYENALLRSSTSSPQQQCYEDRRLALSTGEGKWKTQRGENHVFATYIVTETWSQRGIAFRAGASLAPAAQIVPALPDGELSTQYLALLDRTRAAHASYPVWRNASLGLAFAGLGIALGGLAVTLDNPSSTDGLVIALGGAGVALLSIIPTVVTAFKYESAIAHDVDTRLFVHSEWASRLTAAAAEHNRRVAAECGYDHPDVPMTPTAQQMLGVPGRPR